MDAASPRPSPATTGPTPPPIRRSTAASPSSSAASPTKPAIRSRNTCSRDMPARNGTSPTTCSRRIRAPAAARTRSIPTTCRSFPPITTRTSSGRSISKGKRDAFQPAYAGGRRRRRRARPRAVHRHRLPACAADRPHPVAAAARRSRCAAAMAGSSLQLHAAALPAHEGLDRRLQPSRSGKEAEYAVETEFYRDNDPAILVARKLHTGDAVSAQEIAEATRKARTRHVRPGARALGCAICARRRRSGTTGRTALVAPNAYVPKWRAA